jgi:hypothetical protein
MTGNSRFPGLVTAFTDFSGQTVLQRDAADMPLVTNTRGKDAGIPVLSQQGAVVTKSYWLKACNSFGFISLAVFVAVLLTTVTFSAPAERNAWKHAEYLSQTQSGAKAQPIEQLSDHVSRPN